MNLFVEFESSQVVLADLCVVTLEGETCFQFLSLLADIHGELWVFRNNQL